MKYLSGGGKTADISRIGLGTARFGTAVSEVMAFEMLDLFMENGGNVLDTGRNYSPWNNGGRGKSEACIGKWMDLRKSRDKIILCTKGGVSGAGDDEVINLSPNSLLEELKESKEALGTDYIDLYLLHKDEKSRPVEEIVETAQRLREAGRIKRIGVANWDTCRLKQANEYAINHGLEPFTVLQTWWSMAEYKEEMWDDPTTTHMEDDMYRYLLESNMVGMAYTSQCKGFFQKAVKLGVDNIEPFLKYRIVTERNLRKLDYVKAYCEQHRSSATDVVVGYITSNIVQGIALISCSSVEQLEDVLRSSDYELPTGVIEELDRI